MGDDSRLAPGMGWSANALVHKILCTKSPRAVETAQGQSLSRQDGQSCPQNRGKAQKSPEMPSNCARPDQRRAKRDSQSQTASRSAENGLSNVVAPSIGEVCVRSAAAGGIVEIPPPTIGANVVKFSLASHTAGVESPVRRALVRQNHQRQPVPARSPANKNQVHFSEN